MADIGNKPFRVYRKSASGKGDSKKSLDDIESFLPCYLTMAWS
jgi:hypothetical protein